MSFKSDEEKDFLSQDIIRYKVRLTFLDDDFTDYTEDEKELNARVKNIEKTINNYDQKELWYTKESILNPLILRVLAHCIKDTDKDLDVERLNYLIGKYNRINDFINNDEKHNEILGLYNDIVDKDIHGFYKVNDAIARKILQDSELDISDKDLDFIKEAISMTWENKKEILKPSEINTLSEEKNGINFKHFIFCEEYLKRGKIKPTCEYLGISRNTAYLWLKDDKVQDYLKSRKDEIKRETDNTFLNTYTACFNELNNIITSDLSDRSEKIKAIDTFLKHYENIERLKQPIQED